jgi:hypothetical protein
LNEVTSLIKRGRKVFFIMGISNPGILSKEGAILFAQYTIYEAYLPSVLKYPVTKPTDHEVEAQDTELKRDIMYASNPLEPKLI